MCKWPQPFHFQTRFKAAVNAQVGPVYGFIIIAINKH